ncbi:hypothetical protein AVEN_77743-1 [Araneus ventricosus]|uniref:Uncharacterized protein n=1 Tax=Araneus ventricosus TaxID=182803 RepID=A0A4Y2IK88_ARAVE|nr:hypothetical protein AVEN_77743-1 [Araneus ventricosus]
MNVGHVVLGPSPNFRSGLVRDSLQFRYLILLSSINATEKTDTKSPREASRLKEKEKKSTTAYFLIAVSSVKRIRKWDTALLSSEPNA